MTKKVMTMAVVALMVGAVIVPTAFAATNNYGNWFDQMFGWHDQWLDQAVDSGQINEGQAQAWGQHFDYMRDFHGNYGMPMMGGFNGNYDGNNGYGMMGGAGYGMSGYGMNGYQAQ